MNCPYCKTKVKPSFDDDQQKINCSQCQNTISEFDSNNRFYYLEKTRILENEITGRDY